MTIDDILELVGSLDDAAGNDSGRERFRKYLAKSVPDVGLLRDYIETCLRTPGQQYNRALQDLVNHAGRLMGFDVRFGRYQGVTNDIGYDGIWTAEDLDVVVEVKTTDAYTIHTNVLLGYVDALISAHRVPSWDHALGLYIVGRTDAALQGLENAIVAERRMSQLRVATVETILSLAELAQEDLVTTAEIVSIIRPRGVLVDDTARLLARIAAKAPPGTTTLDAPSPTASLPAAQAAALPAAEQPEGPALYLLTPVADDKASTARAIIRELLDSGQYVFGERTPGRKSLKPGDRIAFYETGVGVVAEAEVASAPEKRPVEGLRHPDRYPWAFRVTRPRYFYESPVVIDAALRAQLEAFAGRGPGAPWAWFVQSTRVVSRHDFELLTGSAATV